MLIHRVSGSVADVDVGSTYDPERIEIHQGDDLIYLDTEMAALLGEVLIDLSKESTNG